MRSIFLTLLLSAAFTLPAAESRHALVMGVWDYSDPKFSPLQGIDSDVTRMTAKLKELGFAVTVVNNPTLGRAKQSVDEFGATLKAAGSGAVGLFYFSGHGCESEGKNFLVPKGTSISTRGDLDDEALSAQRILLRMEEAGTGVNLVFLDCCRNVFTKGSGDFAPMRASGVFVGFATASAKEANATEEGSPYTSALIREMGVPGLSVTDMHTRITRTVKDQTGGSQVPFQYSGLDHVFCLVRGTTGNGGQNAVTPAAQGPRLAPVLGGKFVYGESYGALAGQYVNFRLTLSANGQAFSGVIEEPYSGFGTPVNGRLYADVVGSVYQVNNQTVVRFTKEYRHHVQPIVKYQGVMNPATGVVSGAWNFPNQNASGTFSLQPES